MGLPGRRVQPDHSGSGILRTSLHPRLRRCLHDVHEHTLRLSSKASLRLSRVRYDAHNHLHHIPVLRNLRQDRPTIVCDSLSPSSKSSATIWTKTVLCINSLLPTSRTSPRVLTAVNSQGPPKARPTMITRWFDHTPFPSHSPLSLFRCY